ncbi:pyridoxamine 5'-phosphate oxidase family protein [Pulveribacter suum]|uniref:General stress protein n=1 Tax=Pulveribacter suum TaxID=2116657 RepID=A0A2P1NHR5_9BURK|nr:pyridoxamine 5'-phosphate oxidase family protein [Pulveribacter suum]AVP56520.1 general stress protein [Pulveribacter suum]
MTTENDNDRTALFERIKDIRFGMLAHRGDNGLLHAHPLTTLNKDIDAQAQLYFFIPRDGELHQRLAADSQVNVSYANPEEDCYVSVSGAAAFIEDMQRKEELWTPMAKAWFPEGPGDPNLVLLAVNIRHAEYWDVKESKLTQLYKMATAAMTGERPKALGEHREITL